MIIDTPAPMIVVEGRIQALRIASGTLNLIQDIQDGAWYTGLAAGLAGQAGMLANAASLLLYEGEEVQHVALLINNRLAIGTFEWLEDLNIDDEVKLVVSEAENAPLFINAILRKKDSLLWLPHSVGMTRFDWTMQGVKISALCVGGTWLMFMIYFLVRSNPFPNRQDLTWLHIALFILMAFIILMSKNSMTALGQQAENIYYALGVPNHERFKITDFSVRKLDFLSDPDPLRKNFIFKFDEALKYHKKNTD